jgi:hypothetical protein
MKKLPKRKDLYRDLSSRITDAIQEEKERKQNAPEWVKAWKGLTV